MTVKWMMNNRASCGCTYVPTNAEHIANILTHGVMIPIAVVASLQLIVNSACIPSFVVAFIYGLTLVTLFSVSTAFHTSFYLNNDKKLLEQLRKSDRAVIYLFIATCYTPWLVLVQLPDDRFIFVHLRWFVWILAGLGVLFELTCSKNFPVFGISFYVLYGLIPGLLLHLQINFPGTLELKLSGISYLTGIMFYKSDGFVPFAHAIWHLFVILGVTIHYLAVYNYFYSKLPSQWFFYKDTDSL